jgi:hypothetical protein
MACVEGVVLVVLILVALAVHGVYRYRRHVEDREDGVTARFNDLRLTPAELLDGYGRRKRRYPLAGLNASVSDTGNGHRRSTVHLTISGPTTSIVETHTYRNHQPTGHNARAFAERVNLAARTLPQTEASNPAAPCSVTSPEPSEPATGSSRSCPAPGSASVTRLVHRALRTHSRTHPPPSSSAE